MTKEQLIQQINKFLEESFFEDGEISFWQEKLPKMDDAQLKELLNLLKEKSQIVTNTNNLFTKIAEDLIEERDKRRASIPRKESIIDMPIDEVAKIFRTRILKRLRDEKVDIFKELNQYFSNARIAGESVVEGFDTLIKAMLENKNIFTRRYRDLNKITVGDWLIYYNAYNDKPNRKNIDRITFINNHEKARRLDKARKEILLKLLKLYDFLLNPTNIAFESVEKQKVMPKARTVSGPPKTEAEKEVDKLSKVAEGYQEGSLEEKVIKEEIEEEKQVDNLRYMANQYPVGSLERKAIEEEIARLQKRT